MGNVLHQNPPNPNDESLLQAGILLFTINFSTLPDPLHKILAHPGAPLAPCGAADPLVDAQHPLHHELLDLALGLAPSYFHILTADPAILNTATTTTAKVVETVGRLGRLR